MTRGDFLDRLREIREQQHLSQSDLAERAGLTYRTIHDIEQGKRVRVQEKTLLLIARALGMTLNDLLNGDVEQEQGKAKTSGSGRALWIRAAVMVGVAAVAAAGILWMVGRSHASWTLEDNRLAGKHGVFGLELWSSPYEIPIVSCEESPWDPGLLLVATDRTAPDGGEVRCLKRATGELVWSVGPDIPALVAAFGEEDVLAAKFSCRLFGYADLDGDGLPEVLVRFTHGRYYPTAVCTVERDGTLRSHYAVKGHVMDLRNQDLDGDGKDEIIGASTNNAKAYQGAMVFILDDQHANGASIDENCDGWSTQPDSALVRVVLPQFPAPYMELLQSTRLSAFEIQVFRNGEDEIQLSCEVGGSDPNYRLLIQFDAELHPLGAVVKDRFQELANSQWPDSLTNGTGPGDPVWLAAWLARHKRFEAGHWPQ
ncbi:MAG: helix-turn-helix transcriptional regulator [Candidatus Krumholzibacteriota bacterium]